MASPIVACAAPRCPRAAVLRGRCDVHRLTTTGRGYGADWQRVTRRVKATTCARCGSTHDLTVDHVVPMSRGGTNDLANLRTLCRACHGLVGDQSNRTRTRGDGSRRGRQADFADPRAGLHPYGGTK